MSYEKEKIISILDDANNYSFENSEPKTYQITINNLWCFCALVQTNFRGHKVIEAKLISWDFTPIVMELDPFYLKDEYLGIIADLFYKYIEQVKEEKSEKE